MSALMRRASFRPGSAWRSCRSPARQRPKKIPAKPHQGGDHLLRQLQSRRIVAEEPDSRGNDRRALHLFPLLRLPAVAGDQGDLSGAGRKGRTLQRRLRAVEGDVKARLEQIRLARSEGHDIAQPCLRPFRRRAMDARPTGAASFCRPRPSWRDACAINGLDGEPRGWRHFAEHEIPGFRAPYLSTGKHSQRSARPGGLPLRRQRRFARPGRAHAESQWPDAASPCRRFRRGRRAKSHRHGLQSVSSAIPAVSSGPTGMAPSRSARFRPFTPPLTVNIPATARRCSSASISR